MKKLLLASFIITIALASCSVTQPDEYYYPQQRVYSNPNYQYDPYYNPVYDNQYTIRRVYDYNTGRYYDVRVPVSGSAYGSRVYTQPTYRRDVYRRDSYRRDNYRTDTRRDYYSERQQQPRTEQRVEQPREKRLPDGTRISPDGTVTLPNGQVKRSQ